MTRREWERFQEREAPVAPAAGVRPLILDSWSRSLSRGVDPEHLGIRFTEVDRDTEWVREGSRVLLGLSDAFAGSHASLALTDPGGSIAWRWEPDRALGRQFDATEIQVGSAMGEPLAGTNGIAVALREGRPATVVGAEHFKEPWHGWACAAAPVRHPISGEMLGAVNIACREEEANGFMVVVLRALVDGVRAALAASAGARERRLIEAHARWRELAEGAVIALDERTIVAGDDAAALGLDRATLWAMIRERDRPGAELRIDAEHVAAAHPIAEGRPTEGYVVVVRRAPARTDAPPVALGPLELAERRVILASLARHGHNKSEVAAHLRISRGTLYERLRRYGLD